jgi:hypothetical protein
MRSMEKPEDLHHRVRRETARTRRAVRVSAELKQRVQATLARSRTLHARLMSERLLAKFRP